MSKTIKQLAVELGVSKQAVQKRISREPLCTSIQPYIYTKEGTKYITEDGENIIKSAFSKSGIDTVSMDKSIYKSTDMYTPIIEVLQSTIDTLQCQLATKDEQIRGQQAQIEQLTAALQQQTSALESTSAALTAAQALHAADKQAVMLLEDQENGRKLSFWERLATKKSGKKYDKDKE